MTQAKESKKGRWIVTSLYAGIMGYGAACIFGSMVYALYGHPDAQQSATDDPMWCKGQLAELHAELENQAQQELQALEPGERRSERWKRWQNDWSARFARASSVCQISPLLTDGYATLNELSTDYGGILQELSGARLHLRSHLDDTIRKLTK